MFGKKVHLFRLFGFNVGVDASWIIIAALVTWSLASSFFPGMVEGLSATAYWTMGALGAVGLFLSIIFHEFWHSLVARRYGLPMTGITLFLFGGISEMSDEPKDAKTEFLMAIAGPASSVVLGLAFFGLGVLGAAVGFSDPVSAVIAYLAYINVILAVFNMLPAFPLDGGRVLRSALWAWKKDLRTATRWASRFGSGLAVALIGLGLLSIFMGQVVGGIWYLIIGMFLRAAAHGSYRRVLVRQALSGERVGNLMMREPVSVSPDMSVRELVDGYFNRYHFKMFPVLENGGRLAGCVTSRQVREVDREEWDRRTVGDIVDACSTENTARPQEDAMDAFQRMQQSGNSRLLVVEGERLRGVIALKDLMGHMSSRMDAQGRQELQT